MARWTRIETLLALNLYFETPFGKQHKTFPPIVELAKQLGRTPSSVGMKLCNFTSLDPVEAERGIKGLSGASKLDREVWNEFQVNQTELVLEIEYLLENLDNPSAGLGSQDYQADAASNIIGDKVWIERVTPNPSDTETTTLTKQRRYQNFFRRIVLRSYNQRCCITGNPIPELLRASHIVPWSESPSERLNPRNGLCLAATFDAAFDRGLIGFDDDYKLLIGDRIKEHLPNNRVEAEFLNREGKKLTLPEKNLPDLSFVRWHRESIFRD